MPGSSSFAPLGELVQGTVFAGDFRVVRKLSEGGMGAVYVALQLSTGRERALKIMRPDLVSDPGLRAKFIQEARIGGRVQSDHVVEVVAAGVDPESNTPYLVMELLQGEDLATTLKSKRPLGQEEITGVLAQLFEAVGAAHTGGIIHRDLKPENVFLRLSRSGAGATVKVLDFGIAKLVEEALSGNTGAVGTPFWMAPEQTERRAILTPSCDVWALGLIAFTLHTGRQFWRAANDESPSLAQFMRELVLEPIPPASDRARELGAIGRIPTGFDAWFARAVNRDPAARFPDARAAWQAYVDALGIRSGGSLGQIPVSNRTAAGAPPPDLGTARTVVDPTSHDEDEGIAGVPPKSDPPWLLIGIGALALVGIGGVAAALHFRSDDAPVAPVGSVDNPKAPTPRCPVDMAGVPGGTFTVGDDGGDADERPAHDVTLNAFCIDLTEVTVKAWGACVKAGACAAPAAAVQWGGVTSKDHTLWDSFCNGGHDDRGEHPVNCVSWDQARAYCKWNDRRLPTEEEWELVARGPTKAPFPWGNLEVTPERLDVCGPDCALKASVLGGDWKSILPREDGWVGTAPVGSYPEGKSPFGAYDLAGNVAEWTASAHCPYPGNNCASEMRTVRGSSFSTDDVRDVRSASRSHLDPTTKAASVGFRCAR